MHVIIPLTDGTSVSANLEDGILQLGRGFEGLDKMNEELEENATRLKKRLGVFFYISTRKDSVASALEMIHYILDLDAIRPRYRGDT